MVIFHCYVSSPEGIIDLVAIPLAHLRGLLLKWIAAWSIWVKVTIYGTHKWGWCFCSADDVLTIPCLPYHKTHIPKQRFRVRDVSWPKHRVLWDHLGSFGISFGIHIYICMYIYIYICMYIYIYIYIYVCVCVCLCVATPFPSTSISNFLDAAYPVHPNTSLFSAISGAHAGPAADLRWRMRGGKVAFKAMDTKENSGSSNASA